MKILFQKKKKRKRESTSNSGTLLTRSLRKGNSTLRKPPDEDHVLCCRNRCEFGCDGTLHPQEEVEGARAVREAEAGRQCGSGGCGTNNSTTATTTAARTASGRTAARSDAAGEERGQGSRPCVHFDRQWAKGLLIDRLAGMRWRGAIRCEKGKAKKSAIPFC